MLLLKEWTPLFDPVRERANIQPLWVKIHSLPFELWFEGDLTMICNTLGRMMDIDEKTRSLDKKSMDKIGVEMNLVDGLPNGIHIYIGNRSYLHEIDYVEIPLKCSI
jgi:hypothetical protein